MMTSDGVAFWLSSLISCRQQEALAEWFPTPRAVSSLGRRLLDPQWKALDDLETIGLQAHGLARIVREQLEPLHPEVQ